MEWLFHHLWNPPCPSVNQSKSAVVAVLLCQIHKDEEGGSEDEHA